MKWNFSLKDILYIALVATIVFFGYRAYKDLSMEVQRSQIAYAQLSDTLARAQNELVTKAELQAFARSTGIDLHRIKQDLQAMGADMTAIGQTVASIEGSLEENQGSDDTQEHDIPDQPEVCELCDIHRYTAATQAKDVKLGEMPIARVEFDASKAAPWTTKVDAVDVEVTTVLGETNEDDAMVFYHEIAMINKTRPDLLDKKFKLKITSSTFKQTLSSNKEFYWWAPHLDLSVDNLVTFPHNDGRYSLGASLGISIMAYGRTTNDNDWRFIRLGTGFTTNEDWFLSVTPVQYNIGSYIPLVSDLWLGAGAVYDGGWGAMLSIGTTL